MKLDHSTCSLCRDQGVTFTMRVKDKSKFVWACTCQNGVVYRSQYLEYRQHIEGHVHWDRVLDPEFGLIEEKKEEENKVIDIFDEP